MRKSRFVVALGLVMALGVATIAYADGASENTPLVEGKIKPTKLDKKKYKPVKFFAGVRTNGPTPGENPEAEYISFGKNFKLKTKAAPTCSAPIEFQSTDAAKAACPSGSLLGSGDASIELPGGLVYQGITVTTFNGPGRNQVRLHTYDPRLAGATPTVFGRIVKSNKGAKYGQALVVDDAPDVAGDAGRITSFNTSVEKKTGVALARCKAKKFIWNRIVTYDDGTKENVTLKQNCKRRRR